MSDDKKMNANPKNWIEEMGAPTIHTETCCTFTFLEFKKVHIM